MSEFTKGKWEVCVDGSVDVFDESGQLVSTYSDVIGRKSDKQLMADARLIAAAPEMYRLLENLYKVHNAKSKVNEVGEAGLVVLDVARDTFIKQGQELLAKIDGKEE